MLSAKLALLVSTIPPTFPLLLTFSSKPLTREAPKALALSCLQGGTQGAMCLTSGCPFDSSVLTLFSPCELSPRSSIAAHPPLIPLRNTYSICFISGVNFSLSASCLIVSKLQQPGWMCCDNNSYKAQAGKVGTPRFCSTQLLAEAAPAPSPPTSTKAMLHTDSRNAEITVLPLLYYF